MSKFFDELYQGLAEAIEYEKGIGHAKVTTYKVAKPEEFTAKEIRKIRVDKNLTQESFSEFMGVSKKTVEAWEQGYSHPSGPARRLLKVLATENIDVPYIRKIFTA